MTKKITTHKSLRTSALRTSGLIITLFTTAILFQNFSSAGIKGFVDGISMIQGQPVIRGWACDYGVKDSITVHLYIGGTAGGGGVFGGSYTAANINEAAVGTACGVPGTYHRFSIPIAQSTIDKYAGKAVYVYGLSAGSHLALTHSGKFVIPHSKLIIDGNIDGIFFSKEKSKTEGTIDRVIRGWACDLNLNDSIDVHVYVGGPAGHGKYLKKAAAKINAGSTSAIAKRCGFKNGAHRFEILLTEAEVNKYAGLPIYIHGIAKSKKSSNALIINSAKTIMPIKRITVSKTSDIQPALDKAYSQGGGVVSVKAGKYYLTKYLNIKSNTALISQPGVQYIRNNNINMLRNQLNTASGYKGYGNIAVIGGVWEGNSVKFPRSFATFALGYANNLLIRGVTLTDVTYGGHAVDLSSSTNVLIEDSKFLGYITQKETFQEAVQLDHNINPKNPAEVASFAFGARNGTPNVNVTIRNNTFGANPNSDNPDSKPWPVGIGGHGAVHDKYQQNIKIQKNIFRGMTLAGIRDFKWNDVLVEENKFIGCQMALRASSAYAHTNSSMNADRTVDSGISQVGKNLTFRNNIINSNLGTAVGIYGTNASAGVPEVRWSNVKISGNSFLDIGGYGLVFDKVSGLSASGNALENIASTKYGVAVFNSDTGTIANNSIQGGRSTGIAIGSSSNSKIKAYSNNWQK